MGTEGCEGFYVGGYGVGLCLVSGGGYGVSQGLD